MVHAIIDGAERVLQQEGIAHFSTNRVAHVAGVSIGSLYQYFANKEMILAGVLERGILQSEDLMRRVSTADQDARVEDVLREVLNTLVDDLEPARPIIRDILSAVPLVSDIGVLAVLETRVGDLVRGYLLRHSDRYRPVAGAATLYVGINAIIYVFLKWLTDRYRAVSRDELIDALVAMLTATIESTRFSPEST